MSDWDEDNGEDAGWDENDQETWDENDATNDAKSPSLNGIDLDQPILERFQSYEVLTKKDLVLKQEAMIFNIKEQFYVSREEAAILLRKYQWKMNVLMEDWLTDPERVRKKVGTSGDVHGVGAGSSNTKFTCPLCFEDVAFSNTAQLACGHRYCGPCWTNWLSAEADKGPSAVFTTCIAFKCKEVVPESMQLMFLPKDKRDKYQSWLIDGLIQGNRYLKWCPSPGCDRAVEYKSGGMKEINCPCGYVFCFKCGQEGHRPAQCEVVEKWLLKNSTDSENVNWIIANTKKCPECKVFIEKNQGCNHMTCRNCKHEFCWLCKGKWGEHGSATGGFYKCNKYESDKTTEAAQEETKAEEARNALQKYMFYFTRYDNHAKSIRFAEETRAKAEKVMAQLQDRLGTNYQDVQFVLNAVNAVISCRRVLKWTYCFGYYIESSLEKQIFENHQERLEKFTEELHGLTEKPIEELLENKVRTQIVNYTRVVDRYKNNVIEAIENGLKD